LIDESGGRIIVNRRSGTEILCHSYCGSRSRGPGRLAGFFTKKDVQLVGHGAGLRVADRSRLKFIFVNLSADIAEPSYRLTARRAGEKIFQSSLNLRTLLTTEGRTTGEDEVREEECRSQLASPVSW
jgi:hypothetical protein